MAKDVSSPRRRSSGVHRSRGGGTSRVKVVALASSVAGFVLVLAARGLSSGQSDGKDAKAAPAPHSTGSARAAAPGSATLSPAAGTPARSPVPSVGPRPPASPIPVRTPAPTGAPPPSAPAPPGPATPARQPAPPVPPGPPGPGARSVLYVVRHGDTMWSITDWALGSRSTPARIAASWTQIWDANRKTIGRDPNLIHPGQRLRVPPLV